MATQSQIDSFIKEIAPVIQKISKERGYKVASPIIAQACIESAYGTSSLGYKYHNYFGMKCGSKWKGKSVNLKTKEEYTVGTLTTISDNFRVYDSMEDGVKGYFDFISSQRYANLKLATTPRQYLEYIKADGYATSSTYVNTNMSVITKYGLTQYDGEIKAGELPTLRIGSNSELVKVIQKVLCDKEGLYHSALSSTFDSTLQQAVISYQASKGLVKDGIVGKNTWTKLLNL